ncbi:MAG: hypothetical protein Q4D04_13055 [Clostridia bacterium]|nr:hypothetical protein [Clostridia bacterium]
MKRIIALMAALMLISCQAIAEEPDFDIATDGFMTQLHELMHEFDGTALLTVRIAGYVHRYDESEQYVNFAVLRDYFDENEGIIPYGLDCYYEGDLPEHDAWAVVTGHPFYYEEDGEVYMALMAQQVEVLPDDMRESKLVFN